MAAGDSSHGLRQMAYEIFTEADTDLSDDIDPSELRKLIVKLWERIGYPMPLDTPEYASRQQHHVIGE